jgi:hypothetical protein
MKWKLSKRDIKRIGLVDIHQKTDECHTLGCVVHHWSKHHMRNMPLLWRDDRGIFERTCEHGIGHPDPDGAHWLERQGYGYENIHGCDGCCSPNGYFGKATA